MDLLECSVCLNDMLDRSPRTLSCLHTFCTECLQQLENDKKIHCPTCREVTELRTNGVTELKINFMLRQIKEHLKERESKDEKNVHVQAPMQGKPSYFCQICQSKEYVFKCKDCPKLMCGSCNKRHSDIKEFKSHSVIDLSEKNDEFCQKHNEQITHLCEQCIQPLCTRCMFLEHTEEHNNDFVMYDEGIKILRKNARKLQDKIKQEATTAVKIYKDVTERYQTVKELEAVCNNQKQNFARKVIQIDEILKQTENKKKTYENLTELFNRQMNECTLAAASLNSLSTSQSRFCEKYQKIQQKAEECLSDMKKVKAMDEEYTVPQIVIGGSSSGELLAPIPVEQEIKHLRVVKTLLTIKSDQINCKWDIHCIGPDVLVTTDNEPYHVVRLCLDGRVMARYYPHNTKIWVKNLFVHETDIYMLQSNSITLIRHNHHTVFKPKIDNMCAMLVKNSSTMFISQNTKPGNVYKYDTKNDRTEMLVEGLKTPSCMSMIYTKTGYKYIIGEELGNCVKVYNNSWELLHSFGSPGSADGQFKGYSPMGITLTNMGTILIADQGNSRISHYTMEGEFLSNVVTKADDIVLPIGLCYKYPYLWLTRSGGDYIKCFELTKTNI